MKCRTGMSASHTTMTTCASTTMLGDTTKKNKRAVPATACKGNLRQAAMLTIDAWKHLAAETEAQPFRNGNASHTRQSSAGSRTCAAEIGIGALLLDDPGGASAGGGSGGGGSRRPMGMRAAPPTAASCVGNASNFAGSSGRRPPMTSKTSACVGARNGSGKVAERNSSTRPRIVAGPSLTPLATNAGDQFARETTSCTA